jgi:hypothetical protein
MRPDQQRSLRLRFNHMKNQTLLPLRPPTRKKLGVRSVCFALLLTTVFVACSRPPPEISVTGQQRNSDIDFVIKIEGKSNGVIGLRLWNAESKELFWDIVLDSFMGSHIRYGELPANFKGYNGVTYNARQLFPSGGRKPRALLPSANYYLAVDCQYDTYLAACMSVSSFSFSTDSNGKISPIFPVLRPNVFPKSADNQ